MESAGAYVTRKKNSTVEALQRLLNLLRKQIGWLCQDYVKKDRVRERANREYYMNMKDRKY